MICFLFCGSSLKLCRDVDVDVDVDVDDYDDDYDDLVVVVGFVGLT